MLTCQQLTVQCARRASLARWTTAAECRDGIVYIAPTFPLTTRMKTSERAAEFDIANRDTPFWLTLNCRTDPYYMGTL